MGGDTIPGRGTEGIASALVAPVPVGAEGDA
jgi:hypothetical protein